MSGAVITSISLPKIETANKISEIHPSSEIQFFKSKENIKTCISLLRSDRIFDQNELTNFLKTYLDPVPNKMEDNPFLAMLWMALNNDPIETREKAEDFYIEAFGEKDPKFERGYSWAQDPHVLIAHYLLSKGEWVSENPKNIEFYDDQMAGIFDGNVGFDPGDKLTHLEYLKIKEKGWAPRGKEETEETYLTKLEGASPLESPTYLVKKWLGTPALNRHSSVGKLFIPGAIYQLDNLKVDLLRGLEKTSKEAQDKLGVPDNSLISAIGAPGSGKSSFITQKLLSDSVVYYSMDCIKDALASTKSNARKSDFHFVASKLKWAFANEVKKIPVLVTETPATDGGLLSRFLRDYSSREYKFIYDIAVLDPNEAVERKLASNPAIDRGYLETSARNAQINRRACIATLSAVNKMVYQLFTNEKTETKEPNFVLVSEMRTKVSEGQNANYAILTK